MDLIDKYNKEVLGMDFTRRSRKNPEAYNREQVTAIISNRESGRYDQSSLLIYTNSIQISRYQNYNSLINNNSYILREESNMHEIEIQIKTRDAIIDAENITRLMIDNTIYENVVLISYNGYYENDKLHGDRFSYTFSCSYITGVSHGY